jgi:glutamate-1-semialdehyde 2,1-aminomutase
MSNSGLSNAGPLLWEHAKTLIPGGNQLLSKKPERFAPGLWPTYYTKAKGCEVWDLEGNHFYDFASMGVGTCSLGYADPDVNAAVFHAVEQGSMSSLNCPEEVALAERLIGFHPWADMARFARTGGEACAIAIRIARAATRKDKIAFCGYHGWHDWYISSNLADQSNLDGQLLPGLKPVGVPRALKGTAFPFNYNCLNELEAIVAEHGDELGAIIMEPERYSEPAPGFLEGVRKIATKLGAVLIVDEVTSGFRINLGGVHLTQGFEPDLAIFGKALGNGYPISAVIGRRAVMDAAQDSFISSTLWTERIGFAAALATLDKMEKEQVPQTLIKWGERLNAGWKLLGEKHNLAVTTKGIPPLTVVGFPGEFAQPAMTYYTQEMLGKGYLLGAAVYTCQAYTEEIIDGFLDASDEVFARIKQHTDRGDISQQLTSDISDVGFKRLT